MSEFPTCEFSNILTAFEDNLKGGASVRGGGKWHRVLTGCGGMWQGWMYVVGGQAYSMDSDMWQGWGHVVGCGGMWQGVGTCHRGRGRW